MLHATTRRDFLRDLGLSMASVPFILNLPSLAFANQARRKQRLVVMFSPNGVVQKNFWPDQEGRAYELKQSLLPLEPFQDRTLILRGVCDRVRGDGDSHMRGIGCLLTGTELFPGNVQGGSDTPAGWSSGISIDQEIKNYLQQQSETRTRFGSLEFGVLVPERADTWTRMSYAGPNQPIAPIDDPYQMFNKFYGRSKDQATLASVLDDLTSDFNKLRGVVSSEDRRLLDEHATFVREMEQELMAAGEQKISHPMPQFEPGVKERNDNIPQISKMQ
ncbi:MAG TPA: DUF1552 domain-containing protein, partial [Planctomycetaceae bacterium]|nr:DUF1552 domain-containing protein [Planctomycetaceae bacterium]